MSPGVSIRTSFLPVFFAPKIPHGSEPCSDDMARYTEWASEGLAHHFAVESDELCGGVDDLRRRALQWQA